MIKQFDWKFLTDNELFADLKITELPDNKKPMTKMFRYDLEFNEDTHWKLVQLSALKKMHQEDFVEELLTCVMEVLLMDEEKEEKEKDTQASHIEDINKGVAHETARSREIAAPAPVAGGLVDRVTRAVTLGSNPDICVNIWSDIAACTAIIEVAKWLEECDLACARGAARLLNQEAQ